jgi:hypothetical protein
VLAVRALILVHRNPGGIPDFLREHYPPQAIREYDDVQWVATESDPATGVPNMLEFFLQNCVDGAREVTIKLTARNASLILPEKIAAKLGPCEVRKVAVPVRPRSAGVGNADIDIAFAATGQGGRRVRKIHAAQSKSPSSTLLRTLTAVTTGVVVWGGGEYFPFTIHPTPDSVAAGIPREPQVSLVWSPSASAGAEVARTATKARR